MFEYIESIKGLNHSAYKQLLSQRQESDTKTLVGLLYLATVYNDKENFNIVNNAIMKSQKDDGTRFYYEIVLGLKAYHDKQYNTALSYYVRSVDVGFECDSERMLAEGYRYVAIAYRKLGDLEKALYYIEKSVKYLFRVDSFLMSANVYATYGLILFNTGAFEHAKRLLIAALEHFKQVDDYESQINYKILLVNLHDLSETTGDYESADYYYNKIKHLIRHEDNPILNKNVSLNRSKYLKRRGNYEEALDALETYITDSQYLPYQPGLFEDDPVKMNLDKLETLEMRNRALRKQLSSLYEVQNETMSEIVDYQLEEKIAKALTENRIEPYFQLKWSLDEQKYIGAEALIRWFEEGVSIPPNQFIGDIENNHIIVKVSEHIIHESLKFCREVVDAGWDDFVISVNISPYQLAHQDLHKLFMNELMIHNLEGRHVEVEITERSFLEQNPYIIESLYILREMGIRIALDDFGTGYSSLACVNHLPIEVIKIDRSLLNEIVYEEKSRKLLAGIVRMMKELDLHIVAEGVEYEGQVEILSELGCDAIQGYYYAKPCSKNKIKEIMESFS